MNYNIDEFKFFHEPFLIKFGKNSFSKDGIHLDIKTDNLNIKGDIRYSNNKNIKKDFINPNIMGPFSYIPFMECNHAILSMQNTTNGIIDINDNKISFDNDLGYIEKRLGASFPKSYVWCQGNDFQNSKASFMLSIADIPFKMFRFRGIICVLITERGEEYKFTTYNNAKLTQLDINKY